jgi:predicted DNA-binding transcriptional regulator AlpA
MSQTPPAIPATGFLRLPQVLAIFPIGKSTWWKGCQTGRFPKPVKLGPRTTAWRAEDIAALLEKFSQEGP